MKKIVLLVVFAFLVAPAVWASDCDDNGGCPLPNDGETMECGHDCDDCDSDGGCPLPNDGDECGHDCDDCDSDGGCPLPNDGDE